MLKLPNCDFCVHRISEKEDKCKAYPKGIPVDAMVKAEEGVECVNGYSFAAQKTYTEIMKPGGLLGKLLDKIGD